MNTKLKDILNATWKVGLGLIGAGAALFGLILLDVFYKEYYGRDCWGDRTLSQNVVVRAFNNNTVRIWDKAGRKYLTGRLRWVSLSPCDGDSLTVYCDKEGKRGYVNAKTGEIVIPAQYSKAWNFSEGLAAVLGDGDRIGFIDKDNRLVIDYIIPFEMTVDYVFKGGYCRAMQYNEEGEQYYAMYRKDGSIALGWDYSRIDEYDYYGYRIVTNREGSRLVDLDLNNVLPDVYDEVEFAPGRDAVYVTKNYVKQLVSYDGKVIQPFVVDCIVPLKYTYDDGYGSETVEDPDIVKYFVNDRQGLMDARTGQVITPASYWGIRMFSRNLIIAELGCGSESILLDRKGRVVEMK